MKSFGWLLSLPFRLVGALAAGPGVALVAISPGAVMAGELFDDRSSL